MACDIVKRLRSGNGQFESVMLGGVLHDRRSLEAADEIERLRVALADAIRRPMGVVPASAEGMVTERDLVLAEARRPAHPLP
jgi:NAD-dependent DNA ligase